MQSLGSFVGRDRLGLGDGYIVLYGRAAPRYLCGPLWLQCRAYSHSLGNRILPPLLALGNMGIIRHCSNCLCTGGYEYMGRALLYSYAHGTILRDDVVVPAADVQVRRGATRPLVVERRDKTTSIEGG